MTSSTVDYYATGEKLHALLRAKGIRQLDFALDCDVTPTTISRIVSGTTRNMRMETACRISSVLGVGLDDWIVLRTKR